MLHRIGKLLARIMIICGKWTWSVVVEGRQPAGRLREKGRAGQGKVGRRFRRT